MFAYSVRSKTISATERVVRVSKKPSVSSVLQKVGDLSSRGHKIRILFPHSARAARSPGPGRRPSPPGCALSKRKGAPHRNVVPGGTAGVDPKHKKASLSIQLSFWGRTCSAPLPFPSTHQGDSRQWLGTSPASGCPHAV